MGSFNLPFSYCSTCFGWYVCQNRGCDS